MQNRVNYNE